jgi:hypothetical protein
MVLQIAITCFIAISRTFRRRILFLPWQKEVFIEPFFRISQVLLETVLYSLECAKFLQSVYFFILFQLIKCVLNTLNHLAPRTNTYKMYHSMYRCIKVVPRPSEAFESSWWDKAYRPSRRKSRSDAAEKPRAGAEQSET